MDDVDTSIYQQGMAAGILYLTEVSNPGIHDKTTRRSLYRESLLRVGKSKKAAEYWVDFFLADRNY